MLRELQQDFYRSLFETTDDIPVLAHIKPGKDASSVSRFAVYRGSLFGGLSKALAATYPVCQQLVGETFFGALAYRYIARHPSGSPDLNDYGEQLAELIRNSPAAEDLPYLADVARLEWAWHRAFNAADPPVSNLHRLHQAPSEQYPAMRFKLTPDSSLLASPFPVQQIWAVNQADHPGDEHIDLASGGCRLYIWRQALNMHMDELTPVEWDFLTQLKQDTPFGELCEQLLAQHPEQDMGQLLGTGIQRGWISRFEIDPDHEYA